MLDNTDLRFLEHLGVGLHGTATCEVGHRSISSVVLSSRLRLLSSGEETVGQFLTFVSF